MCYPSITTKKSSSGRSLEYEERLDVSSEKVSSRRYSNPGNSVLRQSVQFAAIRPPIHAFSRAAFLRKAAHVELGFDNRAMARTMIADSYLSCGYQDANLEYVTTIMAPSVLAHRIPRSQIPGAGVLGLHRGAASSRNLNHHAAAALARAISRSRAVP